jgi:predicted dehydrogenase
MARAALPVGVIGGGRVASAVHIPLLARRPDLYEIVAVIENDAGRAAMLSREYPGITIADDLTVAVEKGARALICATPWPTHRAVVTEALGHGMDVLVEKPASLDPVDLETLIEAERQSGATVAVGYMKRHDPAAIRFAEMLTRRMDRLRRITVDIVDPDSPSQVAHRLITPTAPSPSSRTAARQVVTEVLPDASPGQRTVYERGIGASLIHQINLIHVPLTPHTLRGHIAYGRHWANGTAVTCGWWPTDQIAVQMSHIRSPECPGYHEVLEALVDDSRLILRASSPYLMEQGMQLTEIRHGRVITDLASPQSNGFIRQLENWARFLQGEGPALPSLTEALRDLAVAREAALACEGARN